VSLVTRSKSVLCFVSIVACDQLSRAGSGCC
jgi:hypothetical protein